MIDDSLILKVHGISAGSFLQEQLDGDLNALAQGHWTYATYCNEEGKVLAFLWVFPWADGILLRLPRSVAAAALAQLRPHAGARDITLEERGASGYASWVRATTSIIV